MHKLDINDPYHILFIEDTKEQIEQIEQELLNLESGSGTGDSINNILRMAHSLKGSSATLELTEMESLVHQLESLLQRVRDAKMPLDGAVMEVVLAGVDVLKMMTASMIHLSAPDIDVAELTGRIQTLLSTAEATQETKTIAKKEKKSILQDSRSTESPILAEDESNNTVEIIFTDEIELKAVKSFMIICALQEKMEVVAVNPSDYEELDDDEFGDKLKVSLNDQISIEEIRNILSSITDIKSIHAIQQQAPGAAVSDAPGPKQVKKADRAADNNQAAHIDENTTVRVNINKINKLINLVGELVIDKEALNKLGKDLRIAHPKDIRIKRLLDVFTHISYLGGELQEIVLSTRMLPLENIFNKFPRMVRDISQKCGKNIRFIIEGKETGIDRGIIEELVDPLTHLLRNAVDHGIDDEAARISRGKPATGTITLSASQGENHVIITVSDDGSGIDISRVRQKTIEKGFLSAESAEQLSDEDIIEYIFEPGFTTSQEVTSISGRGVGLDVVKSNISKVNGIIDVKTKKDCGTSFIIKLPLTLAIIKAMLIRESECTFAIPVASIIEIIRLKTEEEKKNIHFTAKNEVFNWRDQVIPMVRLGEYFELTGSDHTNNIYIIVVGHGEKKMALLVDKVLGEQEIVIKSMVDFVGLDKLFGELKGVSGVSILGDGSFAHILDIASLGRKQR